MVVVRSSRSASASASSSPFPHRLDGAAAGDLLLEEKKRSPKLPNRRGGILDEAGDQRRRRPEWSEPHGR
jgi:hypothetical protein